VFFHHLCLIGHRGKEQPDDSTVSAIAWCPNCCGARLEKATTADMRERTGIVGEKMRAENGLATAVGRVHAPMAS
jgi:hypothetical protein